MAVVAVVIIFCRGHSGSCARPGLCGRRDACNYRDLCGFVLARVAVFVFVTVVTVGALVAVMTLVDIAALVRIGFCGWPHADCLVRMASCGLQCVDRFMGLHHAIVWCRFHRRNWTVRLYPGQRSFVSDSGAPTRRDVTKEEGSIIRTCLVGKQLCALLADRGYVVSKPTFFYVARGATSRISSRSKGV